MRLVIIACGLVLSCGPRDERSTRPTAPVGPVVPAPAAPRGDAAVDSIPPDAAPPLAVTTPSRPLLSQSLFAGVEVEGAKHVRNATRAVAEGTWCADGTRSDSRDVNLRVRFAAPIELGELRLAGHVMPRAQVTVALDDGRQLAVDVSNGPVAVEIGSRVQSFELHSTDLDNGTCLTVTPVAHVGDDWRQVRLVPHPPSDLGGLAEHLEELRSAIEHCDPALGSMATDRFALSSLPGRADLVLAPDALVAKCRAGALPPLDPAAALVGAPNGELVPPTGPVRYRLALRDHVWRLAGVADRRARVPVPAEWQGLAAELARRYVPFKVSATGTRSGSPRKLVPGEADVAAWCARAGATLSLELPLGAAPGSIVLVPQPGSGVERAEVALDGDAAQPLEGDGGTIRIDLRGRVITRATIKLVTVWPSDGDVCFQQLALRDAEHDKGDQPELIDHVAPAALEQIATDLVAIADAGCDRNRLARAVILPFSQDRQTSNGEEAPTSHRTRCADAACLEQLCRRHEALLPTAEQIRSSQVSLQSDGKVQLLISSEEGLLTVVAIHRDRWKVSSAIFEPRRD